MKSSLTADEMRMRERVRGTDYPVMTQGKVRTLFFVYLLIVIKLIIFKYPYSQLKAIVDTWEKGVILEGLDTAISPCLRRSACTLIIRICSTASRIWWGMWWCSSPSVSCFPMC